MESLLSCCQAFRSMTLVQAQLPSYDGAEIAAIRVRIIINLFWFRSRLAERSSIRVTPTRTGTSISQIFRDKGQMTCEETEVDVVIF